MNDQTLTRYGKMAYKTDPIKLIKYLPSEVIPSETIIEKEKIVYQNNILQCDQLTPDIQNMMIKSLADVLSSICLVKRAESYDKISEDIVFNLHNYLITNIDDFIIEVKKNILAQLKKKNKN